MRVLGLAAAVIAVGVVGGCAETGDGRPVAEPRDSSTATTSMPRSSSTSEATATSVSPVEFPTMGVTPTLRETIPPNALVCLPAAAPGTPATAQIGDAAAPKVVVSLPEAWTAAPGPTGLTLTGPDGMSGAVDITETALDPAAAFEKYSDDITASAPISSVSVLPAESCGFSGQRLMGVLSGGAQGKMTYEDRIAHVWTNTNDYLVVIHVAAPQGSPAFDAATSVLTADFAVTIP
ncbi:hypothetical protein [Mycolicibacterium sp.]|uniref:hypothetical protein n=1 Tax=Mycolicibacterium sp. TaxID=2320850 RepID=UPI001A1C345C|nr:hypothetical protein [Mycolicibacterium sp.]MBJ7340486.1 hypothetical protein [Mycolicibacterium sp.]